MFLFLAKIGRWASSFLLDCLFPKECFGCRAEGEYLCAACRASFQSSYPAICFGCRRKAGAGRLCADCQPRFSFDGLLIAADYEQAIVQQMIRALKYRFVRDLAGELSLLLKLRLARFLEADGHGTLIDQAFFQAVVVPVPLSRRRQRWRGFNQAELLARAVADFCGLASNTTLLERAHRRPQAILPEAQRLSNLRGAFRVLGPPPSLIILVDDVVTTGATFQECAQALKRAGAEEVWCIAVAKG